MRLAKSYTAQLALTALGLTAINLIIHLNVDGMISWDQEYWRETVAIHTNSYPFSLRPLTTGAVLFLSESFHISLRNSFILVQYPALLCIFFSFGRLLLELGFSSSRCLIGVCALAFCFPLLGAHFTPNFTWDDYWGYLALIWMTVFLLRGRLLYAALALATVAITKENLLVALPALYFFRDRTKSPGRWLGALALPVVVFVAYRLYRLGYIAEETISKFTFNFSDFNQSRQSLFSLLEAFGLFWFFGALAIKQALGATGESAQLWRNMALCALTVGALTLFSVLGGAYARETRLFFTPFVFLIPLTLWYWQSQRLGEAIRRALSGAPRWSVYLAAPLTLAICVTLVTLLFPTFPYLPMADTHRAYLAINLTIVALWWLALARAKRAERG